MPGQLGRVPIALLVGAIALVGCSWDYPIWIQRDSNADPLYRFRRGAKAGYINQSGKIVIPPFPAFPRNYAGIFHNGLMPNLFNRGYVDRTGARITFAGVDRVEDFSEGLAAAKSRELGMWGYINTRGAWVISPRFESKFDGSLGSFEGGFARVEVRGRVGYIDLSGDFAIEPIFMGGAPFMNGMARVVVEGPCADVYGDDPCAGVGPKSDLPPCKYAFIDRNGKIISNQRYEGAGHFSEGLAPVRVNDRWGYIDKIGEMVISPQFLKAASFSEGLASVSLNGLFGFIDRSGEFVIRPQFPGAGDFHEGLATVQESESGMYFINRQGQKAFPGKFAVASDFFQGVAHVQLSDGRRHFAYIDRTGKSIFTYHDP